MAGEVVVDWPTAFRPRIPTPRAAMSARRSGRVACATPGPFSVDHAIVDRWIADVGEQNWQEVTRLKYGVKRADLGWTCVRRIEHQDLGRPRSFLAGRYIVATTSAPSWRVSPRTCSAARKIAAPPVEPSEALRCFLRKSMSCAPSYGMGGLVTGGRGGCRRSVDGAEAIANAGRPGPLRSAP